MTDRDRLVELFKGAESKVIEELNKHLELNEEEWMGIYADHLIANGVIVLPCKFLQKCFAIPTIENNLSDITEMKCIGFSLSHDSYNANLITDKNKLYQPCFGAFGKTVFLTREEVEKALERSNGNA